MIKKHLLLLVLLPLLFVVTTVTTACSSRHSNSDTTTYHISNDSSQAGKVSISVAKVLPLVTAEGEMIAEVSKYVTQEGNIFIFDKRTQSVYIFDSMGDQQGRFNRQGSGPGEYVTANDISVDSENNLYIADIGTQKIIRYEYPDYEEYTAYPLKRAFLNFDVFMDWIYISNLSEGNDLKIKLAARSIDSDSLKVLSTATVENEYRATGAGVTHLWESENSLLYYDRFTPFIYKLSEGNAEKYIMLNESDIPDKEMIHELISLPPSQRYRKLSEPTDKIIDITACFETSKYILLQISTIPIKYVVIDKSFGNHAQISTLLTDGVRSSIGLIGTYGDYFVTATVGDDNHNPELILLDISIEDSTRN